MNSELLPKGDTFCDIPELDYGFSSITGTRSSQQDYCGTSVSPDHDSLLAVVCDGMGGLSGGELASRTTVETILSKYAGMPENSSIPVFFNECVNETDLIINSLEENGVRLSAGTTLTAVHIRNGDLHWVSVGDSRLYLVRGNAIKSLCAEHNYGEMLRQKLADGEITQNQYNADTQRKDALTSYIGIGAPKLRDINEKPFRLLPDDTLVLCSDGLFKALTDEEILREVLRFKLVPALSAENLTSQAMARRKKAQDNTTAVVIHINIK